MCYIYPSAPSFQNHDRLKNIMVIVYQPNSLEDKIIILSLSLSLTYTQTHSHQPTHCPKRQTQCLVKSMRAGCHRIPITTLSIERLPVRSSPKKPARESAWKNDFSFLKFNWSLFLTKILLTYTPNNMTSVMEERRHHLDIVPNLSKHLLALHHLLVLHNSTGAQQRSIYFPIYLYIDVIILSVQNW